MQYVATGLRQRSRLTAADEMLDRLVRLAATHFSAPIAQISLLEGKWQWVAAAPCVDRNVLGGITCFCRETMLQDSVIAVSDTAADDRFADDPLVRDTGIRFFAGVPLNDAQGNRVAALCIMDREPRPALDLEQKRALEDFATIATGQIQAMGFGGAGTHPQRRADDDGLAPMDQQMLRLFIEHAPAAIAMFDTEMRYLAASKRWRSDYHLNERRIIGRSHYEVFPDIPERWKEMHRRCLAGDALSCDEDSFEIGDGKREWLRWALQPWHDALGQVGGLLLFTEIITERKEIADALERSSTFLNAVLTSVRDGIVACDADGMISTANPAARKILGLGDDVPVLGEWKHLFELYLVGRDAPLEREESPLVRAMAGECVEQREYIIAPHDGHPRRAVISAVPLFDDEGRQIGAVASLHDMTRRRETEEKYLHAQKMETVGQLTGGLAHDFNNLLAVILGNLQLLEGEIAVNEKSAGRIASAIGATRRGGELTRRLLAFSRKQTLARQAVDASALVAGMADMLQRTLGESVTLRANLAPDLWTVTTDANQLEAAILNLCVNARDAMDGSGALTISTRNIFVGQDLASRHPELSVGDHAVITVVDTGSGMDQATLRKAFDPFFTTKEAGKGSGLGLSMVYGFIHQSGGDVIIRSRPGEGTAIDMYLPRDDKAVLAPAGDDPGPGHQAQPARVLLVEDNREVLDVVGGMLKGLGHTVWQAQHGHSAMRRLRRDAGKIDLLLTDIIMPGGMNGLALANEAQKLSSEIKVLYISGFARGSGTREGAEVDRRKLLKKPFTREELGAKIAETLAAPGA